MIPSGFDTREVTDPQKLFGHNEPNGLLDRLCTMLQQGTNCQVLGERKAGKSSLLRCCAKRLRAMEPSVIPVYLNFLQETGITGIAGAYQFIVASIHAAGVASGLDPFRGELKLGRAQFVRSERAVDVFRELGELRILDAQHLLDDMVEHLVKSRCGVALLIDEYEYLLRATFGGHDTAFFPVRNLSMQVGRDSAQPKPLTFVIAGALSWNSLCEALGSPQMNAISSLHYVEPISFDAFRQMWVSCVEGCSREVQRRLAGNEMVQEAFTLSGGWPFYGKLIGQHLASGGSLDAIRDGARLHFSVMLNRRHDPAERRLLLASAASGLRREESAVRELLRRGLLTVDEGNVVPRGSLWSEYLRTQQPEEAQARREPRQETERVRDQVLTQIADCVFDLAAEVGEIILTHRASSGPPRVDGVFYDRLRSPCSSTKELQDLAALVHVTVVRPVLSLGRLDLSMSDYPWLRALHDAMDVRRKPPPQAFLFEARGLDPPALQPPVELQMEFLQEVSRFLLGAKESVRSSVSEGAPGAVDAASEPFGKHALKMDVRPIRSQAEFVSVAGSEALERVDVGIVTIREDEFSAVLKRFPRSRDHIGRRRYSLSKVGSAGARRELSVASMRCAAQGTGEAQSAASDLIEDLNPEWLLLVGIAGGVPSDEFTLGDVVASTSVQDFTVEAVIRGREREYAAAGGQMHKDVTSLVAHLPAMSAELEGWNSDASIGVQRPRVELERRDRFYGQPGWKKKVRQALARHFGVGVASRNPIVVGGVIASSDRLVKDDEILAVWLKMARNVIAMEMELAGVYRATRSSVPERRVLAIRGISDVVGFRRDPAWTSYACESAAAFAHALVRSGAMFPEISRTAHLGARSAG